MISQLVRLGAVSVGAMPCIWRSEGRPRGWLASPTSFERSLVETGFQLSDFLECTCLSLPSVCSFGVIDVHMSGFMWFLGIPTQALTPGRQTLC